MRRPRTLAVLCLAVGCGVAAASATADLLPSLPGVPTTVTTTTLPSGIVDTTTSTITGAIDGVLGTSGGSLPDGALTDVLTTLLGGGGTSGGGTSGGSTTTTGVPGGGSAGSGPAPGDATTSGSGGAGTADPTAPALRFTVLSRLREVARTGRLRVRVRASEPAVVAFAALVRPGRALHARRASHRLIRLKTVVLAFRRAGSLVAHVRVPRAARHTLGRVRSARLALQAWTSDAARNQARRNLRRTLHR